MLRSLVGNPGGTWPLKHEAADQLLDLVEGASGDRGVSGDVGDGEQQGESARVV